MPQKLAVPLIVLVEPSAAERSRLAALFERAGGQVQAAESASSALALMRRQAPQAVLVADELPDSGGAEFCAMLRRFPEWQAVPIFLLGAAPRPAAVEHALEQGADDYLSREDHELALVARVRRAVKRTALTPAMLERERASTVEKVARTVAHYIMLPANFITMCAQMLAEQFPEGSDAYLLSKKIDRQLSKLREIPTRLAAIPRMPAGTVPQSPDIFALPDEEVARAAGESRPAHYRVLIVDDEPAVRELVQVALERSNRFIVEQAENGLEGLEMARAQKPDVVILDLQMPVLDGAEMCAQLKQDAALRAIPVIVLTVMTGVQEMIRLFELGASGYLVKPFDSLQLPSQILRLIERTGA